MLKLKKGIITVSILATVLSTSALAANAYLGEIQANCRVEQSWIPFTKDTAYADGCTNYGLDYVGSDATKLWLRSNIKAWSKDDYKTKSAYMTGYAALEGWNTPSVSLRNITQAESNYSANANGSGLPNASTVRYW